MIQSYKMAVKSIGSNKMRAFLTMLGIIIGVMALVILVSLVNGATSTVTDTISSLGSNLLTVTVSDNKGYPVSLDDLNAWMDEDDIGLTAAYAQESFTGKYEDTSSTVQVYGTTASYDKIQGLNLLLGRFIKNADVENHTNICVINETMATELIGYTDCLNEQISLGGVKYTVVGVLEDDDNSLTSVFGSGSMVAYIPYTSLIRLGSGATLEVTSFYVGAAENKTMEQAESAMTALLMDRFEADEDAFSVSSQDVLEDTMSNITSILTVLLGGIAAISLIVGGDRHYEYHACNSYGAHKGNRYPQGDRSRPSGDFAAISFGSRCVVYDWLRHWHIFVMVGIAGHHHCCIKPEFNI